MLILELERKVKGQFTAIDVDSAKLSLQNESALILRIPAESWNLWNLPLQWEKVLPFFASLYKADHFSKSKKQCGVHEALILSVVLGFFSL